MKIHFIDDAGDHCYYAPCGHVETKFSCNSSFTKFWTKVTCKNCKRTRKYGKKKNKPNSKNTMTSPTP